jgi:hypothetical protein
MNLHAIELLAVLAYVVLREWRVAQLKDAGKELAQESVDYVRHLSRTSMAGRTREDWIANDLTGHQREKFVNALSRLYACAGNPVAKAHIGEFVPSMNDAQQWSSVEAVVAGAQRQAAKYTSELRSSSRTRITVCRLVLRSRATSATVMPAAIMEAALVRFPSSRLRGRPNDLPACFARERPA